MVTPLSVCCKAKRTMRVSLSAVLSAVLMMLSASASGIQQELNHQNNPSSSTSHDNTGSNSCEPPALDYPSPTPALHQHQHQYLTAEQLVDIIGEQQLFEEKSVNRGGKSSGVSLVGVKGDVESVRVKAFQPTQPEITSIKVVVADPPKLNPVLAPPLIVAIYGQVENHTLGVLQARSESSPQSFQTEEGLSEEELWKEEDRRWNEMNSVRLTERSLEQEKNVKPELEEKSNYEVKIREESNFEEDDSKEGGDGEGSESSENTWRSTREQRLAGTLNKLHFEPPPQGESFHVQDLRLSEGIFVFTYLGKFLSLIQPHDFPVELLRDALWNKVSVVSLILQSLTVEAGFVTCLVVGLALALCVPIFVLAHSCSKACSNPKKHQPDSASCSSADSSRQRVNLKKKTLIFLLIIVIVLLGAGVTAMFITNEQLSAAVRNTPRVLNIALDDVSAFLRNTQRQLVFVVTRSLDRAVEAISADLDGVERLLGGPIQTEITAETGVDVALAALSDVAAAFESISNKVEVLQRESTKTRDIAMMARERLADLRHQVDGLRRQCTSQDRPLCDTVDSSGLEVTFRVDSIMSDTSLSHLKTLRDENLSELTEKVKNQFHRIPQQIGLDTYDERAALKQELQRQKEQIDGSVWPLEHLSRDVRLRVEDAREVTRLVEGALEEVEQWRWLSKLGMSSLVLLIWVLLFTAVICGCCEAEGTSRSILMTSVALICLSSVVLWSVALAALLVGGHGEVYVCRPLYDEPEYRSMTELMDDPGLLFQRGGGFFSNLLYKNQSLDVPIRTVLNECQADRAVYPTFRLASVFNIETSTSHRRWSSLHTQLRRFEAEVNISRVQLLDTELQRKLNNLGQATAVNLTVHRVQMSKPVTGKDLNSFAKQLDSVANQIKDLSTASRIETLASRTRRLLSTNIQPLEAKREELIYQLTALEVLLAPLQRQVNQTVSHLRTIQYFITNQGSNIAQRKTREFVLRLANYLEQYRQHILESMQGHVASCKPIWNLYHAVRVQLCRHLMDPLNGFWFASIWCLLLFVMATPMCLQLIHCYSQQKETLLASSTGSATANGW